MKNSFANASYQLRWALLAVLGLLLCVGSQARAETLLRWKFRSGETLSYVMQMKMTQEMTINGTAIKSVVDQVIDYTWKIGAVDADGTAEVSQTYDRIRMEMKSAQGEQNGGFKYDTANKEEPSPEAAMLAPMMEAMVGKAITMRMTTRGEISDFKVPEDMLAGIKKAPGMEQMGGMFSEEGLKQMTVQASMKFPKEKIAKGDSWNSTLNMPNPAFGNQTVQSTYTYAGPEKVDGQQLEKIGLKLDMKFEAKKDSPTQVEIKNQKNEGAFHFDNAQGHLIDSASSTSMTMEITAGGMTIDADMTVKTTVKLNPGKKAD